MKTMVTSLVICFCFFLSAQDKGVSPIPNTSIPNIESSTYAVVVGISDYQDEGIPDLRFANKDAGHLLHFCNRPRVAVWSMII